uniref:Uncharacterized protein n=1 Tax=Amphimedon queenslandica TaxID=400682 RepID=A0A1X7V5V5_AMPQE
MLCAQWVVTVLATIQRIGKFESFKLPVNTEAKCFQTIVRLGTHTLKVPTYNSVIALKGTMFYLPLPLK